MRFTFYISVMFLMHACTNFESETSELKTTQTKIDSIKACECVNSIEISTADQMRTEVGDCIFDVAQKNKKVFWQLMNYTFKTCPEYMVKIEKIRFEQFGLDQLNYSTLDSAECSSIPAIRNYTWGLDETYYTIRRNDTVFLYAKNELTEIWKLIQDTGCERRFILIKTNNMRLPPFPNDTIIYSILGINDTILKTELTVRNVKLPSYVYFKRKDLNANFKK